MAMPLIGIKELLRRIDAGDPLLLLDVRNDEEFEDWRVEGRRPVDTVHIPYFTFVEDADGVLARLPRDRQIVTICAKGGASVLVADMLDAAGLRAGSVDGGMVAYGEYLEPVRVPLSSKAAARFELWQINRRGKGCLSYVVRAGADALVVDPSRHVGWYEGFVQGLGARIVSVLDTHVHADHVSGGPELATRSGASYFVSAGDGAARSGRGSCGMSDHSGRCTGTAPRRSWPHGSSNSSRRVRLRSLPVGSWATRRVKTPSR